MAQNGIVPGGTYQAQRISDVIKSKINTNPVLQCVVDHETKEILISSVEICFDKNLKLADCDSVSSRRKSASLGSCGAKTITYLDKLIGFEEQDDDDAPHWVFDVDLNDQLDRYYKVQHRLVSMYNTIRMIIWATL